MNDYKKRYTLIVDEPDLHQLLDDLLHKIDLIYEYVDELDDLVHENRSLLFDLTHKQNEKKNHDFSSNHDSSLPF